MTFLDTNILIYAVDKRDLRKQKIAKSIVMSARNTTEYAISAQVLNEFSNVAMNKLRKTREETRGFVELFMSINSVAVRPEWTACAIDIMGLYGIQFYDSLLLATAKSIGCRYFLTEDLNDGQDYDGIMVKNPFCSLANSEI